MLLPKFILRSIRETIVETQQNLLGTTFLDDLDEELLTNEEPGYHIGTRLGGQKEQKAIFFLAELDSPY